MAPLCWILVVTERECTGGAGVYWAPGTGGSDDLSSSEEHSQ